MVAVLFCGFMGYAAAVDWLPLASPAATQVDVDLTGQDARAVSNEAGAEEKTHETEPEEVPSATDIEVEIVRHTREEGKPLRVLIYHTHTYEAYEPSVEGEYKPTERWRTADPSYNMVRVGAELARLLTEEYGMIVVHDDTAFEPPTLNTAYQRSLEAIENYMARGETFDLYLDIHRDAYAASRTGENAVSAGGESVAQVMFLVGKGTGTHLGQAFAQKPDWEENLARAERITEAMENALPGICRPVSTKSSRYNQHISGGALLIEIGNNMNSLAEALAATPYLARAIAETAGGTAEVGAAK